MKPPTLSLFKVALPAGWARDADLSATTRSDASHAGYFDGAPYQSGADSFAPEDGLLFHVVWAGTLAPVDDPVAALRREVDRDKQVWCGKGARKRVSWSESVEDNVASATLVWQNDDYGTVSRSRLLGYATPEHRARIVVAECVMRLDRQKEVDPLCQRVLATLAVRGEERAPMQALPASAVGDDCPAVAGEDAGVPAGAVESKAPRMGEAPAGAGKGSVLYTGEGGSSDEHSSKWMLIAGGALLVVAI